MAETGTTGDAPMGSPSLDQDAENLWEVFRMSKVNWEKITDEKRERVCVF